MGPQIGVEITGVDVNTMDEVTWNKLYQAWPAVFGFQVEYAFSARDY